MNRCTCSLVALVALAATARAADTPRDPRELTLPPLQPTVPVPVDTVLSNGLRVLVFENHDLPVVTLSAHVAMGTRYLPMAQHASYQLLSRVWGEGGAGDHTPAEIDSLAAAQAVSLRAWAGEAEGVVSAAMTREDLAAGLSLWRDLLLSPRLDDKRLDRAKAQRIKDLQAINDDPDRLASTWFDRLLYGPDSPQGKVHTAAEVTSVKRDDLVALHGRFVSPGRTVIGVAGDLTVREALRHLESALGSWRVATAPPPLDVQPWQPTPAAGVYWLPGDFEQCHLRMGRSVDGLTLTSPEYPAAHLTSFALGYMRVYYATRQAGLSYGTGVFLNVDRDRANFVALGSTANDNLRELVRVVLQQTAEVADRPLTESEINTSKTFRVSAILGEMETGDQLVDMILSDVAQGLPDGFTPGLLQRFQSVSAEEIHARTAGWCNFSDAPVVVVVGTPPGGKADLEALGLGPVTVLDPIAFGH